MRVFDTSMTQIRKDGGLPPLKNPVRNIQELNAVLNHWKLKMSKEKPSYANLIQKHAKFFSVSDSKDYKYKLKVLNRLRKGKKKKEE